jgi:uncharacterized protein (TIGR02996 family)
VGVGLVGSKHAADAFPLPLGDADPASWLAYADWLAERGREREQVRALRFARGLTRRPRLVLVGQRRDPAALDPRREEAPVRRGVACEELAGWACLRWWTPAYARSSGWPWRWGLMDVQPHVAPAPEGSLEPYLATPADFPGLVEGCPDLAWRFHWKTAYDLRVVMRDGVPLEVRKNHRPVRLW